MNNEKKKYGKLPGTGSPSRLGPLSRYNALPTELLGTCHEWRANYNLYVTSGLRTASIKCVKILRKSVTNPR